MQPASHRRVVAACVSYVKARACDRSSRSPAYSLAGRRRRLVAAAAAAAAAAATTSHASSPSRHLYSIFLPLEFPFARVRAHTRRNEPSLIAAVTMATETRARVHKSARRRRRRRLECDSRSSARLLLPPPSFAAAAAVAAAAVAAVGATGNELRSQQIT